MRSVFHIRADLLDFFSQSLQFLFKPVVFEVLELILVQSIRFRLKYYGKKRHIFATCLHSLQTCKHSGFL